MAPEEVMNLFNSCWFTLEILKKQPSTSNSSVSQTNPGQQIQEDSPRFNSSSLPTIHIRSKSDHLSSEESFRSDSLSPNSVLFTPYLQTILSGKEATQEEYPSKQQHKEEEPKKIRGTRRRAKKGVSKSLSDLEFEELKGFMDLGFVFSEEDKDSSLVAIIPGLQRLGKKSDDEEQENGVDESSVPRPYLSEAWDEQLTTTFGAEYFTYTR
ncbi:hypothetical protein F0562_013934 [Nyssa sinensis]|uniref:DUF1685 domain-containing protein n=1 Tax=Nyssa sinensis TaxID=561372 RepID=A0A5J4ZRB3_9ASTE|nr:hypothetical protein F0562_013934 [Nyssa sinensis]